MDEPRLWSHEDPFLYDLEVTAGKDAVKSYFGMRKVEVGKDDKGVTRILLNGKPLLQYGPLDQGWWPDGLYTLIWGRVVFVDTLKPKPRVIIDHEYYLG